LRIILANLFLIVHFHWGSLVGFIVSIKEKKPKEGEQNDANKAEKDFEKVTVDHWDYNTTKSSFLVYYKK